MLNSIVKDEMILLALFIPNVAQCTGVQVLSCEEAPIESLIFARIDTHKNHSSVVLSIIIIACDNLVFQKCFNLLLTILFGGRVDWLKLAVGQSKLLDNIAAAEYTKDELSIDLRRGLGVAPKMRSLVFINRHVLFEKEKLSDLIVVFNLQVLGPESLITHFDSIFEVKDGDIAAMSHKEVALENLPLRIETTEMI